MKRIVVALVAAAAVFALAFGSAATLSVDGGAIQAGVDANLTCTAAADVLGWGLETDTGLVNFVRIDVPATCDGNEMFVSITSYGTEIASGNVTLPNLHSAGGHIVHFSPQPAADITDIEVFIEGPNGS
jgi:hypothetical protein